MAMSPMNPFSGKKFREIFILEFFPALNNLEVVLQDFYFEECAGGVRNCSKICDKHLCTRRTKVERIFNIFFVRDQ